MPKEADSAPDPEAWPQTFVLQAKVLTETDFVVMKNPGKWLRFPSRKYTPVDSALTSLLKTAFGKEEALLLVSSPILLSDSHTKMTWPLGTSPRTQQGKGDREKEQEQSGRKDCLERRNSVMMTLITKLHKVPAGGPLYLLLALSPAFLGTVSALLWGPGVLPHADLLTLSIMLPYSQPQSRVRASPQGTWPFMEW